MSVPVAICSMMVFLILGITYLVKLQYQSTHIGTLIHAWEVPGGKNTYNVIEEFQYGEKNHTCLVKRTKDYNLQQAKQVAKHKKRGTTRKLWLYKTGHCTDRRKRYYLRKMGIGLLCPFGFIFLVFCGLLCFSETNENSSDTSGDYNQTTTAPPPANDHSAEAEVEIEMPNPQESSTQKYDEEEAPKYFKEEPIKFDDID